MDDAPWLNRTEKSQWMPSDGRYTRIRLMAIIETNRFARDWRRNAYTIRFLDSYVPFVRLFVGGTRSKDFFGYVRCGRVLS